MAAAVGELILGGLAAAGVPGVAGFALSSTTIFGIGLPAIVGGAAILGAAIGLQAAFRQKAPTPADGSQPLKQSIPPRIGGYGRGRIAGYYMLFEQANAAAYTLCAFHQGLIGGIAGYYLNDDPVIVVANVVQDTYSDGRYGSGFVQFFSGDGDGSTVVNYFGDHEVDFLFSPSDHQPFDIAWFSMRCGAASDPTQFTKIFPQGLPSPSVVADLRPVWDPRDSAQSRTDPSTWKVSYNPIIQLLDYHTRVDGGMGMDFGTLFAGARLSQWMGEADLCDQQVPTSAGSVEARYACNGWYTYDTKPSDIINFILATCDGWLGDAGDGTQAVYVGVYRAPTDAPITKKDIVGFSLSYGQADESTVNVLNPNFTDPSNNYVQVQTTMVIDQNNVSLTGIERPQPLDLSWVQSNDQVNRLAARAIQRLNPSASGSFVTSLASLPYVGLRWIPVQYPFVSGLQDSVIENQGASVDWMKGSITFKFNVIDPSTIDAFDPSTVTYVPPSPGKAHSQIQLNFENVAASGYLALLEDI